MQSTVRALARSLAVEQIVRVSAFVVLFVLRLKEPILCKNIFFRIGISRTRPTYLTHSHVVQVLTARPMCRNIAESDSIGRGVSYQAEAALLK